MELNKIHNMDCLEFMKELPDNYFDLVITDPPYGIKESNKNHGSRWDYGLLKGTKALQYKDKYTKSEWDNKIPSKEIFHEMLRVSKNQVIFGGNYMTDNLPPSSCWIVWDKDNGDNDFADCELAWTSFKTAVRKIKYKWHGMFQENMSMKEKRVHPTQKPIALGRWILNKYAKERDKVFDPYTGSGSFPIACKQLGFDFVGCEISKEYCNIANERLKQGNLNNFFDNKQTPEVEK